MVCHGIDRQEAVSSLRKSELGKLRTEQSPHIIPASFGTLKQFFFSLSGDWLSLTTCLNSDTTPFSSWYPHSNPGTSAYTPLQRGVIKSTTTSRGACPGSSRWAPCNHRVFVRGKRRQEHWCQTRRCNEQAKSEEDVALLSLKLEEGT